MNRPLAGTLLAIGAAIAALLALLRVLQMLGIMGVQNPFLFGPEKFFLPSVNWLGAIMYVILALIWIWAARGLWNVDPQSWLFVVVLAIFYLILDIVYLLTDTPWQDVSTSILVSAVVLIIAILPGTRTAYQQT